MREANVSIDGAQLSVAQSMTIRVAIDRMVSDMSNRDALGKDESGRAIAKGYLDRAKEVQAIFFEAIR